MGNGPGLFSSGLGKELRLKVVHATRVHFCHCLHCIQHENHACSETEHNPIGDLNTIVTSRNPAFLAQPAHPFLRSSASTVASPSPIIKVPRSPSRRSRRLAAGSACTKPAGPASLTANLIYGSRDDPCLEICVIALYIHYVQVRADPWAGSCESAANEPPAGCFMTWYTSSSSPLICFRLRSSGPPHNHSPHTTHSTHLVAILFYSYSTLFYIMSFYHQ
ncbi:hypothetical protein F5Y05DRAFT_225323 [Hypoxylon sp. FL0543]|nr:hypothetical protein F5Y05DRAFT_225323 [Hypoxylon sp. FL0543]